MAFFSRFATALRLTLPALRKLIIAVIGGTVLLIGIALIVLPGPAFIVIPVGLAILATEFAWARHALKRTRDFVSRRKNTKPRALSHAEK
ncbi:MAG TPA: PGPGW domain-containing protein [Chthoniobacterales bacterium]|nr:PGPGW domain-containing protein [Chthoniobacterales bacterium]